MHKDLAATLFIAALTVGAGCTNSKPGTPTVAHQNTVASPAIQASNVPAGTAVSAAATARASAASTGAASTSRTAGTAAARPATTAAGTANRLACFDGVSAYRFSGHFALALAPGTGSQIGALSNLLTDVAFDGAFQSPDSTTLNVKFPGNAGTQDLETARVAGKFYQRTGQGAWQQSTGAGPIIGAISRVDPRTLCNESLAQVDTSGVKPTAEPLNGIQTLHYIFGPTDLARSPGFFGGDRGGTPEAGATPDAAPQDTHLEVWIATQGGYPVRMVLGSGFGGEGTLKVVVDISDVNGNDIAIKAPI